MVEIAESTKFYSGGRLRRVINSGVCDESELVGTRYTHNVIKIAKESVNG